MVANLELRTNMQYEYMALRCLTKKIESIENGGTYTDVYLPTLVHSCFINRYIKCKAFYYIYFQNGPLNIKYI